jgi:hypothetical protein
MHVRFPSTCILNRSTWFVQAAFQAPNSMRVVPPVSQKPANTMASAETQDLMEVLLRSLNAVQSLSGVANVAFVSRWRLTIACSAVGYPQT